MKKYRFLYWLGSIRTDYIVRAIDIEEAKKKFKENKGDKNIISIEELL